MTAGELMELLGGLHPETEVRLATQPSWPLEYEVASVIQPEDEDAEEGDGALVVYLVEGEQLGYLRGDVAGQLGWR